MLSYINAYSSCPLSRPIQAVFYLGIFKLSFIKAYSCCLLSGHIQAVLHLGIVMMSFTYAYSIYPLSRHIQAVIHLGIFVLSFIQAFLAHLSHWLMVSYCDGWMSGARRSLSIVSNCFK